MFGRAQGGQHLVGGLRRAQFREEGRLGEHEAEVRERLEMVAVVLADQDEEEVGGLAVRRAEVDGVGGAGKQEEVLSSSLTLHAVAVIS